MTLDDISTPALLIEKHRLENNLETMQRKAETNDVRLRPHVKTHKSVALAEMQRDAGAQGITAAKPSEAAVFIESGFEDVRVAYPVVGAHKHEQLLNLLQRARISFCIDTPRGARDASAFYKSRDLPGGLDHVEVLIEIDTGHGRTGVSWDDEQTYTDLARLITELPALRLVGILTHAGQSYFGPASDSETPEAALERTAREERDRMLAVAQQLRREGLEVADPDRFEISIGATPTMKHFNNRREDGFSITEIRPGNYVFHDAMQIGLGTASLDDCALTVLSTVVSKRRSRTSRERVYLDAGKKILTTDTGYGTKGFGTLLYNAQYMRPLPHAVIHTLSEEHGWVEVSGGATFDVGDRLRVVPNHACVTVDTQDRLYLVDGQNVIESLEVSARGHVR